MEPPCHSEMVSVTQFAALNNPLPFSSHLALLTLSGISIYICYSRAAYAETVRMFDQQRFKHVHITFGWSLALAWLSFGTEVLAGTLFLLAAWGLTLRPGECSMVI